MVRAALAFEWSLNNLHAKWFDKPGTFLNSVGPVAKITHLTLENFSLSVMRVTFIFCYLSWEPPLFFANCHASHLCFLLTAMRVTFIFRYLSWKSRLFFSTCHASHLGFFVSEKSCRSSYIKEFSL